MSLKRLVFGDSPSNCQSKFPQRLRNALLLPLVCCLNRRQAILRRITRITSSIDIQERTAAMSQSQLSSLIWAVADLLRGDYRQSEYGRVILPFTVLRRLDCVLEPTKVDVLKEHEDKTATGINPDPFVRRKAGVGFYNTSKLDHAPPHGRSGQYSRQSRRLYRGVLA